MKSRIRWIGLLGYIVLSLPFCRADELIPLEQLTPFLDRYCADCHDGSAREGNFQYDALKSPLNDSGSIAAWQLLHDRVQRHEMPPTDAQAPTAEERAKFLQPLKTAVVSAERKSQEVNGRVVARRLNAIEFQTTLSDLLKTPLDIVGLLPADSKSQGFQTVGSALNVSSVQIEAYMEAIDEAIDQVAVFTEKPRSQKFRLSLLNNDGYMVTYRTKHPALPVIDGMNLYATEAMSNHNAVWGHYVVPRDGTYRIKVSAYLVNSQDPLALTMRAGGTGHKESLDVKPRMLKHFEVDSQKPVVHEWQGELLRGHYLHLYPSELPINRFSKDDKYDQLRWKGPGICVQWLEIEGPFVTIWPPAGQELLFGGVATRPIAGVSNEDPNEQLLSPPILPADPRQRPNDWPPNGNPWKPLGGEIDPTTKFPAQEYKKNHTAAIRDILAGKRKPAVPLPDYTKAPFRLKPGSPLPSFGGEPVYRDIGLHGELQRTIELIPKNPKADAERLIRRLLPFAFRRQVTESESDRFVNFAHQQLTDGANFEFAMRGAYKAIFTSPQFLYHQASLPPVEPSNAKLDEFAIAERLAYFLTAGAPDHELYRTAMRGELSQEATLHAQTERLLRDPRSSRFVEGFLAQWLDLDQIDFTSPDLHLYPEYDEVLRTSMIDETHAYFSHLLQKNLPVKNLIDSKFVTINRRLAEHYGIQGVQGGTPKLVAINDQTMRGGLLTQASVLKVTSNGTNTSPVVRGKWVLERMLGTPPPPPPPGIPAVEPDIRGAVTIRQQLEQHRDNLECAACHAKIDPPGIALESFDPIGQFRQEYRILDPTKADLRKQNSSVRYQSGLPVNAADRLSNGQSFESIVELKRLLAKDERSLAIAFVDQLLVFATGATANLADREVIESIVDSTQEQQYGIRSLVHAAIQSPLFRCR
jgi:hypothetical protein